ncbi:hypothetical protein H0H92_009655 [Tricholoma furcatifolium]|nr:hypothetical protein H0H92_009655 [Tricholoma furcatifolium]
MAAMLASRSPSPSGSSGIEDHGIAPSASRPGSPRDPDTIHLDDVESDTATCLWEDCGQVFTHLPTLISHIHDTHIGVHKSNYTCEWATCPRRGLPQTSRFALISHLRSHTGEKPFNCTLPECDKSFTRSDALAKHLRLQHNIEPPPPIRGGSRKRKRADDQASTNASGSTSHPPQSTGGMGENSGTFNTFFFEPNPYVDDALKSTPYANGNRAGPHAPRHRAGSPDHNGMDDDDGYNSTGSDTLPEYLAREYDPETKTIHGRPPAMVMYILMKAKHRYALEQHQSLLEEHRIMKAELERQVHMKDVALDQLLGTMFGPQAEEFMKYPHMNGNGNGR